MAQDELEGQLKALQEHFSKGDATEEAKVENEVADVLETAPDDVVDEPDPELLQKISKDKKLSKKAAKTAKKLAREEELLELTNAEPESSELDLEEKKERVELLRDEEKLNLEAMQQQEKLTRQKEESEGKERDEKLGYLGTEMVGDLQNLYGEDSELQSRSGKKLKNYGIEPLYWMDKKIDPIQTNIILSQVLRLDVIHGLKMAGKIKSFFALDTGFPEGWGECVEDVNKSGLSEAILEEARKKLIEEKAKIQMEQVIPEQTRGEVVDTEAEKKVKRIKYLAENLVSDMQVFYGGTGVDKTSSTDRLNSEGIQPVLKPDGRKDYIYGNALAGKLKEFFEMDQGYPSGWDFALRNLKPLGLELEELQEARRQKFEKSAPVDGKTDGGKKEESENMAGGVEISFEDKVALVESSGGSLIEEYIKYVKEGASGDDIDKTMLELSRAFGFDFKAFAEEWRAKLREIKSEVNDKTEIDKQVLDYDLKLARNPLFRRSDGFKVVKERLEARGIDLEKEVASVLV